MVEFRIVREIQVKLLFQLHDHNYFFFSVCILALSSVIVHKYMRVTCCC